MARQECTEVLAGLGGYGLNEIILSFYNSFFS